MRTRTGPALLAAGLAASTACAQSYDDLRLVRERPPQFASTLQFRIGSSMSFASSPPEGDIFDNRIALDGHVYYHDDSFSTEAVELDLYAGREGAVVAFRKAGASGGVSRLEFDVRHSAFYRDGFYRDGEFITAGAYEGLNWGAYLGFGRTGNDGLNVEVGPYFRRYKFDRSDFTDSAFTIPADFEAYGIRTHAEQNTLQLDRETGRPRDGFVLSVRVDAERNSSNEEFGSASYRSSLPQNLWRAVGVLQWYVPQRDLGTWALEFNARWADKDDRIQTTDAYAPIGYIHVHGDLGVRWDFGKSLSVKPFGTAQWLRALAEDGAGRDSELFFGGGLDLRYDVGDALAFYADYSYLSNRSRAPVSAVEDALGEHQLFVGLELRIGSSRY